MLAFNQLLAAGHIDPAGVRLVRHRDPDRSRHRRIFDAARAGDVRFQEYQEVQNSSQTVAAFREAKHLAGFVVDPTTDETVFMGLWARVGERSAPVQDPFGSPGKPTWVVFATQRLEAFDEYRGRLVIEWGEGTRAWVQRADLQDKRILEIRRHNEDPAFPGFSAFRRGLDEIGSLPSSWAEVLRNACGVYLLVHRASGDQYVGSAYGAGGFYGRWANYADGHGGNVAMKELGAPAEAYDVNVLEVLGSGAADEDVFARESLWKEKLGTRARGLNWN